MTAWPATGRELRAEWDYVKQTNVLGGGPAFATSGNSGTRYVVGADGANIYLYSVSSAPSFTTLVQVADALTTGVAKRLRFTCKGRLRVEEYNGSTWSEILSFNYLDTLVTVPALFFDNFGSGMTDSTGIHIDNYTLTNSALNFSDKQVMCHGNSRTEGAGASVVNKWVYKVASDLSTSFSTGPGYFCVNQGHSGWTVAQLVSDYTTTIKPLFDLGYGSNVYVFEEIINSLLAGALTDTQCVSAIESHIATVKADGWRFVLVTCAAWASATNTQEGYRLAVNSHFVANASALGITVADIAALPQFADRTAAADTTFYTDGVHYTTAGHALYPAVLSPAIRTAAS